MLRNRKNKEQLAFYKTVLIELKNDYVTLDWKIKKDQKFIAENNPQLGNNGLKMFLEHLQDLKQQQEYTAKRIKFIQSRIEFYEYKLKFIQ